MTPGFDARISKYGIEIHTANPLDFKNTITTCGIDKNFETNEPVKEDVGNGYNITCSSNLPRDAEAFSEIKKAIENNNTIKVFGFIEYKTNEITGTNFSGTEHVVLKRITTDKLGVGTGSAKSPEGDTSLKVTLSADKTQAKCEDVITLTATVENNGKNANCILTSTNDNSKTPDDAWNSKPVINGKFEKKTTLMGSNDKDVIYTYGIQCFKDAADKIGVKATDVQITVPKCTAKGEETS